MKIEQDPKLSPGASLDYQQRHERGRAARRLVPRGSHAQWTPMSDRPDRSISSRRRPGTGSLISCRSGTGA